MPTIMEHATVIELEALEVDTTKNDVDSGCIGKEKIKSFAIQLRSTTVEVCSLGASILKLESTVPGGDGQDAIDIAAGYKDAASMHATGNPPYFNVIVGRVANRIANGTFTLDSTTYTMDVNNPPNTLHGGRKGFSHNVWEADIVHDGTAVKFWLNSPDGDQGFPGNVLVTATYSLRTSFSPSGVVLQLELEAHLLDAKCTPVNLANHTYFNLAGVSTGLGVDNDGILDHSLTLESDSYTPVDEALVPTREVRSLDQDPTMDFRKERNLGQALETYGVDKMGLSTEASKRNLEQRTPLPIPYGFDHNYVVRRQPGVALPKVATLTYSNADGRRSLTVYSDAPGVQVYTAHYLNECLQNSTVCKTTYKPWSAICLETQSFPNSIPPTSGSSPSSTTTDSAFWDGRTCILTAAEPTYTQTIAYRLEMEDETARSAYHGSDTDGKSYSTIEAMWATQSLSSWYTRAKRWYEDNCDTSIDGVLGGIGNISDIDLNGSHNFIKTLMQPPAATTISNCTEKSVACECGAGIGRVTKGILLDFADSCDLVESNSRLLSAAPDHIASQSYRCRYYCSDLQDWQPSKKKYTIVWIQWVLCYLTDEDIVKFLKRCRQSLVDGGWIVLKENTCTEESFVVDVDDASVTRSLEYWLDLVAMSGLQVKRVKWQEGFPNDIYPVPMLALQP